MYSFESPRDAILMSTHSIYFQDKIRKPLIMSPTIVGGVEGGGILFLVRILSASA